MDTRTSALVRGIITHDGGINHTSMSVGDVLRDADTGTMYQCAPAGWKKITPKKTKVKK